MKKLTKEDIELFVYKGEFNSSIRFFNDILYMRYHDMVGLQIYIRPHEVQTGEPFNIHSYCKPLECRNVDEIWEAFNSPEFQDHLHRRLLEQLLYE